MPCGRSAESLPQWPHRVGSLNPPPFWGVGWGWGYYFILNTNHVSDIVGTLQMLSDLSIWLLVSPRSGELWVQKLKSHLVRTQSLNVLPLKPGVGHYIAIHATLTAREFFLAYFYPSDPFTCIFSKTFSDFVVVVVVGCG